jgi:hypothetical protein
MREFAAAGSLKIDGRGMGLGNLSRRLRSGSLFVPLAHLLAACVKINIRAQPCQWGFERFNRIERQETERPVSLGREVRPLTPAGLKAGAG